MRTWNAHKSVDRKNAPILHRCHIRRTPLPLSWSNHKNCILKFIRWACTRFGFPFSILLGFYFLLCDAFKMFINTVNLLSTFELATCVRLRFSSCKMSRGQRQRLIIMQATNSTRSHRMSDTHSIHSARVHKSLSNRIMLKYTHLAAIATTHSGMHVNAIIWHFDRTSLGTWVGGFGILDFRFCVFRIVVRGSGSQSAAG